MASGQLFRKEAISFQRGQLNGKVILSLPLVYRYITGFIIALIIALLILFILGKYTRRQPAAGWVQPVSGMSKIWGKQAGVIQSVKISEGDKVNKGDILAYVGTTSSMESGTRLEDRLITQIQNTIENITVSRQQAQQYHQAEILGIDQKISRIKYAKEQRMIEVELQTERLQHVQDAERDLKMLRAQGYITKSQLSDKQLAELESKLGLLRLRQSVDESDNQLAELVKKKELLGLQHQLKLAEYDRELIQQRRLMVELKARKGYTIVAPVSGEVTLLQKKKGQSIESNQLFAVIVPEQAEFEVELMAPSKAVGFIKKGQLVKIRYQAFPYQRYGLYKGWVKAVSEASLDSREINSNVALPNASFYQIKVALESQFVNAEGKRISLRTGMAVEADLVIDELPIWYWFFKPLLSVRGNL